MQNIMETFLPVCLWQTFWSQLKMFSCMVLPSLTGLTRFLKSPILAKHLAAAFYPFHNIARDRKRKIGDNYECITYCIYFKVFREIFLQNAYGRGWQALFPTSKFLLLYLSPWTVNPGNINNLKDNMNIRNFLIAALLQLIKIRIYLIYVAPVCESTPGTLNTEQNSW